MYQVTIVIALLSLFSGGAAAFATEKSSVHIYSRGNDDAPEGLFQTAVLSSSLTHGDEGKVSLGFSGVLAIANGHTVGDGAQYYLKESAASFNGKTIQHEGRISRHLEVIVSTPGQPDKRFSIHSEESFNQLVEYVDKLQGKPLAFTLDQKIDLGIFKKDGKYEGQFQVTDERDDEHLGLKHLINYSIEVKDGKIVSQSATMTQPKGMEHFLKPLARQEFVDGKVVFSEKLGEPFRDKMVVQAEIMRERMAMAAMIERLSHVDFSAAAAYFRTLFNNIVPGKAQSKVQGKKAH